MQGLVTSTPCMLTSAEALAEREVEVAEEPLQTVQSTC